MNTPTNNSSGPGRLLGATDHPVGAVFLRAATDQLLRRTLTELYQHSTPVTVSQLAARLSVSSPTADQPAQSLTPRTTACLLAHSHLPRLAEAELIDYRSTTDPIELTPYGRAVLSRATLPL